MRPRIRIAIAQIGARHRYKIPKLFQYIGYDVSLITDVSEHNLVSKLFRKRFGSRVTQLRKHQVLSSSLTLFVDLIPKTTWLRYISLKSKSVFWTSSYRSILSKVDLLYVMYGEFPRLISMAKKYEIPVILDIYVSPRTYEIVNEECIKQGLEKRYTNVSKILERLSSNIASADLVLAPSEWVASGILHYWPDAKAKIRIVPYGMSISEHVSGKKETVRDTNQFLFVGNDGLRKGLHYLINAFNDLAKKNKEIKLLIAGSIEADDYESHRDTNIHFLGKVSKETLVSLYQTSAAIISPSLSEGLPGSLIEAASYGCPIVTTIQSGLSISHGIEGLVIKDKDVRDITEKLEELISNPLLRDALSKNSYSLSNNFNEESWSKRLKSISEEVLK